MSIKHNHVNTAGNKPVLAETSTHEIVINDVDGTLWTKNTGGEVMQLAQSAPASGGVATITIPNNFSYDVFVGDSFVVERGTGNYMLFEEAYSKPAYKKEGVFEGWDSTANLGVTTSTDIKAILDYENGSVHNEVVLSSISHRGLVKEEITFVMNGRTGYEDIQQLGEDRWVFTNTDSSLDLTFSTELFFDPATSLFTANSGLVLPRNTGYGDVIFYKDEDKDVIYYVKKAVSPYTAEWLVVVDLSWNLLAEISIPVTSGQIPSSIWVEGDNILISFATIWKKFTYTGGVLLEDIAFVGGITCPNNTNENMVTLDGDMYFPYSQDFYKGVYSDTLNTLVITALAGFYKASGLVINTVHYCPGSKEFIALGHRLLVDSEFNLIHKSSVGNRQNIGIGGTEYYSYAVPGLSGGGCWIGFTPLQQNLEGPGYAPAGTVVAVDDSNIVMELANYVPTDYGMDVGGFSYNEKTVVVAPGISSTPYHTRGFPYAKRRTGSTLKEESIGYGVFEIINNDLSGSLSLFTRESEGYNSFVLLCVDSKVVDVPHSYGEIAGNLFDFEGGVTNSVSGIMESGAYASIVPTSTTFVDVSTQEAGIDGN